MSVSHVPPHAQCHEAPPAVEGLEQGALPDTVDDGESGLKSMKKV